MFTHHLNYWAVLIAVIIYFLIGFAWYSLFFGKTWGDELKVLGITIKKPSPKIMAQKLTINVIANIFIVIALACLIAGLSITSIIAAIQIGLLVSIGFIAATIAIICNWESRSLKLFFIDSGFHVVAVVISAIILALWK